MGEASRNVEPCRVRDDAEEAAQAQQGDGG